MEGGPAGGREQQSASAVHSHKSEDATRPWKGGREGEPLAARRVGHLSPLPPPRPRPAVSLRSERVYSGDCRSPFRDGYCYVGSARESHPNPFAARGRRAENEKR